MNRQNRLWGAALALTLGLGALARGQDGPGPTKHYYNKTSFRIPVVIEEPERAALTNLKLYVRQPPGNWVCAATGPADQSAFAFQAPRDGEYWFNIVTVDRSGKPAPEDLGKQEPALIVVVDTQPPAVDVKPLTSAGKTYLQCRLQDACPDYSSIKIEYQSADGAWLPLDGLANAPGVVQLSDPHVLDGKVRVRAADRAGNTCEREFSFNSPKVAAAPPAARPLPLPDAAPPARTTGEREAMPAGVRTVSDLHPPGELPPPPPAGAVVIPPAVAAVQANKPGPLSPLESDGGPLPPRPAALDPVLKSPDPAPFATPRADAGPTTLINSTHCRLDFALDQTAGGPAEVEVWATADGGSTWKPVGASKDGKSPAVVDFPGEGKYGVAFVVKPAAGLPSALPKPGDAPDGWLEIDTTLPAAQLLGVALGTGADIGHLVLNWSARDANLGPEPVAFWYATQPGGPWQVISDHVANSGTHRWPLPKSVGPQVWLRMEVRDRAGNVTRCETPQAVALEGPRARVRVLKVGPAKE